MKRMLVLSMMLLVSVVVTHPTGVAQTDDVGNEPTAFEATLLPSGDTTFSGRIEIAGDVDCFIFQADAGTTYTIETSDLSNGLDTLLVLFDRNSQTVLDVDDNSGANGGSLILFSPGSSGLYFVCVRSVRATQGVGDYTLTIATGAQTTTPPPETTAPPPPPPPTTDEEETSEPPTVEPPAPPTTNDPETTSPVTSGTIQRNGVIALLGGDDDDSILNVQNYLLATGAFPSVDAINVSGSTPSAAELNQYEAVMVWADSGFQDAEQLGNLMADYVDRGGGVVVAAVSFDIPDPFDPDTLGGRFFTGGYYAIEPNADNVSGDRRVLGAVSGASHPVMAGIDKIDGGPSSLHSPTSSLTPGSQMLASWDNGDALAAVKTLGQSRRVDINLFPPSSLLDPDLWPFTPDNQVPQLMVNALLWVSGRDHPFNPTPESGPGRLEVLTAALSVAATPGDNPAQQTLTLRNSGGQTLSWSASVDVAWLTLSPAQGELSAGETQNILVNIAVSALAVGVHNATITVSAPGADTALVRVPLTLNLSATNTPTTPTTPTTPSTPETPTTIPSINVPNSGNVINVPGDFFVIQDAINAAQEGDTISIGAGVYALSTLTIDKPLTLRGAAGLGNTILRGNLRDVLIQVNDGVAGVAFEGLDINRGIDGIRAGDGAVVVINNSSVSDNLNWGVRLVGVSAASITNSTISSNGSGGVSIDIAGASNTTTQVFMSQNRIQSNFGCGVFVASDESGIQVSGGDNVVSANSANLCDNGNKLPDNFIVQSSGDSDSGNVGLNFDGDNDGVPDADDFCPVTPGKPENNGCP